MGEDMWVDIVYQKYIHPLFLKEWFRVRDKSIINVSIMWKFFIQAFAIIGDFMVWNIGCNTPVSTPRGRGM